MRGIHRSLVDSPHKWPIKRKAFRWHHKLFPALRDLPPSCSILRRNLWKIPISMKSSGATNNAQEITDLLIYRFYPATCQWQNAFIARPSFDEKLMFITALWPLWTKPTIKEWIADFLPSMLTRINASGQKAHSFTRFFKMHFIKNDSGFGLRLQLRLFIKVQMAIKIIIGLDYALVPNRRQAIACVLCGRLHLFLSLYQRHVPYNHYII